MALLLLATLALLGAACGGGGSSKTPTAAVSPTAVASATAAVSPTPEAPTPSPCPTPAGALAPVTGASPAGFIATLDDVKIESQPCLDRITFTFTGDTLPGYDVRYVAGANQCGSGAPVSTVGEAQLQVKLQPANAHDDAGQSTIDSQMISVLYPAIKEAVMTCDFEADVTWVVGTSERPFAVTATGSAIVIDVYH